MKRCLVVGADAERTAAAIPREIYEVTIGSIADASSADLVVLNGIWLARLRPLSGIGNALDGAITSYLIAHGILEESDLPRLNLDELAGTPGIERKAFHSFVRDLARSGRYPDAVRLQDFVVRRGIFL